ncbi:MAG: 2-amino-4-hydroxy-6-hydroxymethyldihydropteridine diphosphokinase [Bdellovibrionales bacterium]|nr:2-amino-4-hydroxy-6-hydroxymethyldihydropteridine diphosphokinase [Bdellovibrionales bacterium]
MKFCIALGSNLGNQRQVINTATSLISTKIGKVLKESELYQTKPLLHKQTVCRQQNDFLNSAILIESELPPEEVLSSLLSIEIELGRDRSQSGKWEPRLIDLDIIAVESIIIDSLGLKIPHPEMHKRKFVLEPMQDIWPDWRHPILGKTCEELFNDLCSRKVD